MASCANRLSRKMRRRISDLLQRSAAVVPVLTEASWNNRLSQQQKDQQSSAEDQRRANQVSRVFPWILQLAQTSPPWIGSLTAPSMFAK